MSLSKARSTLIHGTIIRRKGQHTNCDDEQEPTTSMMTSPVAGRSPVCRLKDVFEQLDGESDDSFVGMNTLMESPRSSRSFRPRIIADKLETTEESVDNEIPENMETKTPDASPPHRKLRGLRLFDTPHTPKYLLDRARRRRVTGAGKTPRVAMDMPPANVNPFTPVPAGHNEMGATAVPGKRSLSLLHGDCTEDIIDMEMDMPAPKRLALHEINTSRFNEEFHLCETLGDGEFGSVFKCSNKLDGIEYAIKKSKKPVAGSAYERVALNEVYAHAVLEKHPHVVRYYSAWAEMDHMFIQNEYCNGGSLADLAAKYRKSGTPFTEEELQQILYQVASGLKYIHSQNLVHLDIKPGNIFIHRNPRLMRSPESGFDSEGDEEAGEGTMYKIGDLGHVTSVFNPSVEDGDCRYLPAEILAEKFDCLTKADIFSFGLTMFELASGQELPKNGETWHAMRRGELPDLPDYSKQFNNIIKSMVRADPRQRPSASMLLQDKTLCPHGWKSSVQLRHELAKERLKTKMLTRKLVEARRNQFRRDPAQARSSRLVGRKQKKCKSLTIF